MGGKIFGYTKNMLDHLKQCLPAYASVHDQVIALAVRLRALAVVVA